MLRLPCADACKSPVRTRRRKVQPFLLRHHSIAFSPFCNRVMLIDSHSCLLPSIPRRRKMRLLPLIAATYFMVSGGPYGIEDILGGAGYRRRHPDPAGPAVCLEPAHGADDRRTGQRHSRRGRLLRLGAARARAILGLPGGLALALGQHLRHGHLSRHLRALSGQVQPGAHRWLARLRLVARCGRGVLRVESARRARGRRGLGVAVRAAARRPSRSSSCSASGTASRCIPPCTGAPTHCFAGSALSTAILVAMWNYMGWDNASTVAQEVENPQRNYPRAMIWPPLLTAVTYLLPLAAMALAGLSPESFSTGDWVDAATALGGPLLAMAVVAGGADQRSRHVQRAGDELHAPAHGHGRRRHAAARSRPAQPAAACRGSACCSAELAWALALKLPFERLISIDLILYGSSLLLEFVALVVLRIREPELERPFNAGNLPLPACWGWRPQC